MNSRFFSIEAPLLLRRPATLAIGAALLATASQAAVAAPAKAAPAKPAPGKSAPAKSAAQQGARPLKTTKTVDAQQLEGDQRIIHALNRLGFGPRAGDLERVREMGLGHWIDEQLSPSTIDDSAVERKLADYQMLQMSSQQLTLAFAADNAKLVKAALALRQNQQAMGGSMDGGAMDGGAMNGGAMDGNAMPGNGAMQGNAMPGNRARNNRPGQRRKQEAKLAKLGTDPLAQLTPQQKRKLDELASNGMEQGVSYQGVGELQNAKVLRAVESQRQLQEVLVDFWSNHFNLDVKKGQVRTLKILDERTAIRPFVLGKFRDLLGASAKSPAMLIYLDNARSTREYDPAQGGRARNRPVKAKKRGGVNENYARELMELHTLGVDGGYTQKDVQEVARCLTGWSIERESGEFIFRPFAHDNGEKTVLGHKIPAGGGIKDGEMVLDILASHPSTAHFIAHKLCVRFVADEPPAALVERAAKTFLDTGGDLQQVMKTIVYSPEFFSKSSYRAKIKSPFEFAVSAARSLGGEVQLPDPARPYGRRLLMQDGRSSTQLGNQRLGNRRDNKKSMILEIALMGQPLFSYQAPTGWPEDSREWVSAGALIARLNFALDLTGNQVSTVVTAPDKLADGVATDDHAAVLQRLYDRLLGGDASAGTRATLQKQVTPGTPVNVTKLAALVLGSPEFQRR